MSQMERLVKALDRDGNGYIEYEEFLQVANPAPEPQTFSPPSLNPEPYARPHSLSLTFTLLTPMQALETRDVMEP